MNSPQFLWHTLFIPYQIFDVVIFTRKKNLKSYFTSTFQVQPFKARTGEFHIQWIFIIDFCGYFPLLSPFIEPAKPNRDQSPTEKKLTRERSRKHQSKLIMLQTEEWLANPYGEAHGISLDTNNHFVLGFREESSILKRWGGWKMRTGKAMRNLQGTIKLASTRTRWMTDKTSENKPWKNL